MKKEVVMTREEQIEQAWFCKACLSTHCYDEKSFKEAAQWADKTMIDRVCKWLVNNNEKFLEYDGWNGYCVNFVRLTEALKKAMEE